MAVASQSFELETLAKKLASEAGKRGEKPIAVFDVGLHRGDAMDAVEATPFGTWLGDQVAAAIASTGRPVVERKKLAETLEAKNLAPRDGFADAKLWEVATSVEAGCMVTGTFAAFQHSLGLTLILHCSAPPPPGSSESYAYTRREQVSGQLVNMSDFAGHLGGSLESFRPSDGIYWAGESGVSLPHCTQCPNPDFSRQAIRQKYTGSVVLSVVVNKKGRTEQVRIVKGLGMGLDDKAIKAVRSWRLTPAKDPEGNVVSVRAPIEITFRLY